MYARAKILVVSVAVALSFQSCWESSPLLWNNNAVAKVYGEILSTEQVRSAVPTDMTGEDSAAYAKAYVGKWIASQLKLHEAEETFKSSNAEIERMVEEYRKSLLVHKIEQSYLDSEIRSAPDEDAIAEYYRSHGSDFKFESPYVKGDILYLSDSYPRKEKIAKMMGYSSEESRRDFEALCGKRNLKLQMYDNWIPFEEFLSSLPVDRKSKHEDMLSDRGLKKIHNNNTLIFYRIRDVRRAGDVMPLELVRDNIIRIMVNREQSEIIRQHEQSALQSAMDEGDVRVFRDDIDLSIVGSTNK